MITYTKKQYIFPPRPEDAIGTDRLDEFEDKGDWLAQVKKNGTCSIIFVSPDKTVTAMSRHNADHKAWQFTDKSRKIFRELPGDGWYVFCAELLHSKGGGIRDTNYIFDILVNNGKYLIGSNYLERHEILFSLFCEQKREETHSHYILDTNAFLAKIHLTDFRKRFMMLDRHEDEGLVLKQFTAPLQFGGKMLNNTSWNIKCRKKHENFAR